MSRKHLFLASLVFWKSNKRLVLDRIAKLTEEDCAGLVAKYHVVGTVSLSEQRQILRAAVKAMSKETVNKVLEVLP